MKNLKKVIALILCLVTVFSVMSMAASAATTYDPSKLVEKAESYIGYEWGRGLCLNFVANIVKETYGTKRSSSCCAHNYGNQFLDSYSQKNIPIGADVFFTANNGTCNKCGNQYGHIGIYVGDGYIIHDWNSYIQKHKISDITKSGKYKYRGWGWHGDMSFSTTTSTSSASTTNTTLKTETWYKFTNSKSSKLLNVYGSKSASNTNVTVYQKDGTSGQDFKLIAHGTKTFNGKTYTKYIIVPRCASKCALNVYGSAAKNGSNVNIWTKTNNSTQDWIFESVSEGYIIRSANNTKYVLTASGTKNSSNVKLATYSSGNTYQIWKLS